MKAMFLLVPAQGHINGSAHFSELLRIKGWSLHFLVAEAERFSVSTTISSIRFNEKSFIKQQTIHAPTKKKSRTWVSNLFNWLSHSNLLAMKRELDSLDGILKEYTPDLFFVDSFYSYVYFLFPDFQHKIILINTQFNGYRDERVPPINSTLHPNVEGFNFKNKLLWNILNLDKTIYPYLTFGQDPWSVAKQIARGKGYDLSKAIWKNKCFHPGINGVPELIAGYQSLDLPRTHYRVPQYYLATQIDPNRKMNFIDSQIYNDLISLKKNTSKKMLYCSLGTLADVHNSKASIRFFSILIELLKLHPEWHLVLSLQGFTKDQLPSPGSNVSIYKNVPQVQILPLFDAMITHAGPNTLVECIYAEVPMVAFPLNSHWDQNGNAARIVYHQLGRAGNIGNVKMEELEVLILDVLEKPNFKENVKKMKQNFIAEYNPEKIIDFILQYSNSPKSLATL